MTTCLYVSQIPAPHPHVLTKVFATLHRQIVCTWNCFSSNYRTSLRKNQGRQVFAKRYFSKFVYFYVAGCLLERCSLSVIHFSSSTPKFGAIPDSVLPGNY